MAKGPPASDAPAVPEQSGVGATRTFPVVPLDLADANALVARLHRHHPPVRGHKFSLGLVDESGQLRGAAIVGRPVARGLDDGWTLEVTRLVTDGAPNACSKLYAAARRAALALAYRRLVTYTLATEGGASLRAAGWRVVAEVRGRSWSCESRPRRNGTRYRQSSAGKRQRTEGTKGEPSATEVRRG